MAGVSHCIYREGDKTDCSNYRDISLLSATYTSLSNILLSRLTPYVDPVIGTVSTECGQTSDLTFCLRQAFLKHFTQPGNTMEQYISYLHKPRKPIVQWRACMTSTPDSHLDDTGDKGISSFYLTYPSHCCGRKTHSCTVSALVSHGVEG